MAVRSVTAKPLAFWMELDGMDSKAHVSPSNSTRRQLVCQQKFFLSIQRAIQRAIEKHLESS